MAKTDTIDAAALDAIEHVIETLDTAFELGEPTIHPTTKKLVSDPDYDKLYGKNGSERAILKKHRPDSNIFKGVTASRADFSKATKCVHNPPMTSIGKADGTQVEKCKRLGEWMLYCLGPKGLNLTVPYSRTLFETNDKGEFANADTQQVEDALEELSQTKDGTGRPVFVQSLKHDGCAVSLYYKKSRLTAAGNRPRDGVNAASVLEHVKQVTGIPNSLLIPDLGIIVRGEIEQSISDFTKVNAAAKAAGEKTYENPRNSTAGAMNPLGDPKVVGKRKLRFVGYSVLNHDDATYETVYERALWANKNLKVPFIRINPFKFSELKRIEFDVRPDLDYMIDGVIIEVNNLDAAERMGHHGDDPTGDPRAKLAWKFEAERAKVVVEDMAFEMNRTGKLSVVALFPKGARLAGTTVRRCTCHNVKQMIDGGVDKGAEILIYKAGEIIPYWEDTIKPAPKVNVPTNCPSCKSALVWSASKTDLLCQNDHCPARNIEGLLHYLKTFGVKGVGDSTVTSLVGAGLVKTPADFYRLDEESLQKADLSERQAILAFAMIHMIEAPDKEKDNSKLLSKVLAAASRKKTISLAKFIATLGIPGSGKGTGSALAEKFGTLDAIRKATATEFETAQDIGDKTAKVLAEWFGKNGALLDDLLQYVEVEKPKTGILTGKNFCFSGSFNPDKEYWIARVEEEGAKVTGAPSRKTHYFVYGPGSGNKKDMAEQLKKDGNPILIVEIEEVEKLLGLDKDDDRTF